MSLGTSQKDRFGYALPYLSPEEAASMKAFLASEAAKEKLWTSSEVCSYTPKKLKQLVREGIPKELRKTVWLQLSKADTLKGQFAVDHFATLTRKTTVLKAAEVEAIVTRFFPTHRDVATSGSNSVTAISRAFILHTGRSVQQNFICIAAFLVTIFGSGCDEDLFWIMVGLLDNILPASCCELVAGRMTVEQHVLMELLSKRCIRLLSILGSVDLSAAELTETWFPYLFIQTLPSECVVRVWDCLLSEGPKVLFRVALALLKRQEAQISTNPQKVRNIQWRISRTYNANELMKMAFKGIGSLPLAVIAQMRCAVETSAERQKASQAERLNALLRSTRPSPQPSTSSARSELSTVYEEANLPTGGETSPEE